MRTRLFPPFVVVSLLIGCQSIPETDPGWTREELEVAVKVDPLIAKLLRQQEDAAVLDTVVSETIFELADVGLRFYPVPSNTYEEGQQHPQYLLTVQIQDLSAKLAGDAVQAARESKPGNELESVRCTAVATLVKRRNGGPPLIVGKSSGFGQARAQEAAANLSSMLDFELQAPYGLPPRLRSEDLRMSIRTAVHEALEQLVKPIDREFETE
jgi:hypothetical protein